MDDTELVEENGMVGVIFQTGDNTVKVCFGTIGEPSGHVSIISNGKKLVDKDLATEVKAQAGLSGSR